LKTHEIGGARKAAGAQASVRRRRIAGAGSFTPTIYGEGVYMIEPNRTRYPRGVSYTLGMATSQTTPARGYSATKDQLLKRLRRIEGQVRGVQSMVDEDRYCIDVLTQISAVQAALDKVALGLMDDHARHCVIDGPADLKEERTEELMAAVARLMRRG
jgi:DNA-binding FrmR family transcriptional regulator